MENSREALDKDKHHTETYVGITPDTYESPRSKLLSLLEGDAESLITRGLACRRLRAARGRSGEGAVEEMADSIVPVSVFMKGYD